MHITSQYKLRIILFIGTVTQVIQKGLVKFKHKNANLCNRYVVQEVEVFADYSCLTFTPLYRRVRRTYVLISLPDIYRKGNSSNEIR